MTLVPGELRGYRQFDLVDGRLMPVVHAGTGPWTALTTAVCARDATHRPPVADCTCGLYAMHRPGSATVSLGAANAVVAAQGRVVLADRGFRAERARVEAVALPTSLRLVPGAARQARERLAVDHPRARVYTSTRRMLRDHPPHDVRALGVDPPPDRSRAYRLVAAVVWAVFVVAGYSIVFLPRDAVEAVVRTWWPAVVTGFVAWQAALVWLLSRLMQLQMPERPAAGNGAEDGA